MILIVLIFCDCELYIISNYIPFKFEMSIFNISISTTNMLLFTVEIESISKSN